MTTKEYMQAHENDNLSWCRPFVSKDGKGKVYVILLEGEIDAALVDGEEMTNLTKEDLKAIAERVNPDHDLYSGWSDTHIILEAMTEIGCAGCPFFHDCAAMDDEIEE